MPHTIKCSGWRAVMIQPLSLVLQSSKGEYVLARTAVEHHLRGDESGHDGKQAILDYQSRKYGTGGERNILQPPALMGSAVTAHKTFGPTDLTSMYFMCTRRVFDGIRHRTQAFRSGVRCSNH
ncbi:uncharacterized protein TNCV_4194701 [Trichonephila clavipes]|nr:uncharacterized protein TNCV_4194701 [Trichonephila clavipes]